MYLNVSSITHTLSYGIKKKDKRRTTQYIQRRRETCKEKNDLNAKPNEVVSRYPYLIFAYYHCKLAFLFCLNRIFAVPTLNARGRTLLLLLSMLLLAGSSAAFPALCTANIGLVEHDARIHLPAFSRRMLHTTQCKIMLCRCRCRCRFLRAVRFFCSCLSVYCVYTVPVFHSFHVQFVCCQTNF